MTCPTEGVIGGGNHSIEIDRITNGHDLVFVVQYNQCRNQPLSPQAVTV